MNTVLDLLKTLRACALEEGLVMAIEYHEEDSYLTRFANSAISLNTSEHLVRLKFTAFDGYRRAEYGMITDPKDLQAMREGLRTAGRMARVAEPLSFEPTLPYYMKDVVDERAYDPALAGLTSDERLAFFNTAAAGLETEDIKLSGIFSNGTTTVAQICTTGEGIQYFRVTDAKITVVLSSESQKWEVNAEQSAQKKSDLDAAALHRELAFLARHYQEDEPVQLSLGKYRVVFGPAATAEVMEIAAGYGSSGGAMRRGYSYLKEEDLGRRVFSPLVSVSDDPGIPALYGRTSDRYGRDRAEFPVFKEGVFQAFTWEQDDADEFGRTPTGHDVDQYSFSVNPGSMDCADLEALAALPRDEDVLYIPYIHYMNIVNPSKGLVTGSSRFGALLLRKDGSVNIPYNVRLTQAFADFFGDGVRWLSKQQVVYNTSSTYGRRNPVALRVPRFLCVDGIEISHSNASY
ncbi:MAG: metallopeptidase TldD-related protein [Anaerolineaceae bacterium]|nr:metallopeptidase TldD-related protein [Anaerolineaceae bacterium]